MNPRLISQSMGAESCSARPVRFCATDFATPVLMLFCLLVWSMALVPLGMLALLGALRDSIGALRSCPDICGTLESRNEPE